MVAHARFADYTAKCLQGPTLNGGSHLQTGRQMPHPSWPACIINSRAASVGRVPRGPAVAPPQKATWTEGFATNREGGYTRTMDFDADIREQIFARLPRAPEV